MNIKNSRYEITAVSSRQYPADNLPDIAFVGKSNVGKSSMINSLTCNSKLARTGKTPGKTREIIFFNIDDTLRFVDLPGYGYAKVSEAIKEKWGKMIEKYLKTSLQLKIIFLLIDIRHEPSANDRNMYEWIVYQGYHPIIIATKLDKINRSQIDKQLKVIRKGLNTEPLAKIIPFSSLSKQGRDEIWDCIEAVMTKEIEEEVTMDNNVE